MRANILLCVGTAICLIMMTSVCLGAQESAPNAFFPQSQYEFGPVIEGSMVVHDFVIKNRGTAVLNIERVRTG